MEILVFLFVVSNINLIFAEEKEIKEMGGAYEVHPEPEEVPQNDQIAESSHSIVRNYGVVNSNQFKSQNQIFSRTPEKLNGADVRYTYSEQNVQQQMPKQEVSLREDLRHNTVELNNVEVLQPSSSQEYNQGTQQIYLQQYPLQTIQILGAEASPLRQIYKNGHKTLGYSSYIEHMTEKDEEEIKSALKEGSVGDIKRLIPKSGISFQIYQTDKNVKLNEENQKTETEVHPKIPKGYSHNANLQYRNKPEVPVVQFRNQPAYEGHHQITAELKESQQAYLKNEIQDHQNKYKISQNLLQPVGATSYSQDQQDGTGQAHHYTQPFNLNSQKTFLEANDKSIFSVKPQTHFKINVDDNSYSKTPIATEFNSLNAEKDSKHTFSDINSLQYQKQWNFDTKSDGSQKVIKNIKRPNSLQHDKNLLVQSEPTKELHYIENHGSDVQRNINEHKISIPETPNSNADINYLSNSYIEKANQNGFAEHLAKKAYLDKETAHDVINRLSDNYIKPENVKTVQNHFISHLGTTAYSDSQATKDNYRERFPTNVYSDSETAKSSHVAKSSFIETKNGQNNFDHQKALEGSTSFDIKNAIDNTGTLVHQANYKTSTAEMHPFDDVQKQQFAYIIPKIPTSTVLIGNSIQENPIVEGHPVKDFGQAVLNSPHLSYQTVSSPEVSGKFFHQPQTVMWTPEHLKQGNAINVHQPLIKLHLPKEEIYKFVETPNVELPTGSISHISYPQQKQPYILHYNVPLIKHSQEIHFQPKTKTRIQNGQASHIKLAQPINIDWSLFKTTLPNYSTLALKPELSPHVQETGKKIVPILVRKRKNRSNNKEIGIVYGKVNNNRKPTKPNHRQEKSVRINLLPEVSAKNQFEAKGERKNEFSVSASYKVDRSLESLNSS